MTLSAKMKGAMKVAAKGASMPNNGSWWLMVVLSTISSAFMITALVRDDAEKKWRYFTLAGCIIMLGMLIGSMFVPAIGKITMPQCAASDIPSRVASTDAAAAVAVLSSLPAKAVVAS